MIWFPRAASKWVEALPVGNGRLGAMVFGDIGLERLQINDDTLWSGGPSDWDAPGGKARLAELRRATLAGDSKAAETVAQQMMGAYTQSYLPLGDVWLTFEHGNLGRDYRRTLHLGDAVASVTYKVGDVAYTREVIASQPAGVIVVRITADRPGLVTFDARVSSRLRSSVTAEGGLLRLHGTAPAQVEPSYYGSDVPVQYGHDGGEPGGRWAAGETAKPRGRRRTLPGMRFELAIGAVTDGGRVVPSPSGLRIEGASSATLVIATATGFNGYDKDPALAGRDPGPDRGAPGAAGAGHPVVRAARDARGRSPRALRSRSRSSCRRRRRRSCRRIAGSRPAAAPIRGLVELRVPVRPLPADREQPPGHAARQPAGPLERRASARRGAATTRSTSTRR